MVQVFAALALIIFIGFPFWKAHRIKLTAPSKWENHGDWNQTGAA